MSSRIEWTQETWNPIAGCTNVSEGCRNCYARNMSRRLAAMGQVKYSGLTVLRGNKAAWTGKIHFDENALLAPLKRKRATTYFVNSMSDLFHEEVREWMIAQIMAVAMLTPGHTYQCLTKRPERMQVLLSRPDFYETVIEFADELAAKHDFEYIPKWPLPNWWQGVSVEDQKTADERIPLLLDTPAAVRFISAEPLLGPIDLNRFLYVGPEGGWEYAYSRREMLHWAICGGESGHDARPMHPDWARGLRDQCLRADVSFFFKQWGEWAHRALVEDTRNDRCRLEFFPTLNATFACVGKKAAGDLLDGVQWHQYPAVAGAEVLA